MILIQNDNLAIANLKFLLICFELLSGLKINYHKSEVIVMGVAVEEQARVDCLLNCQEGVFPFKYLGFPMSDKKLIIADLEPLVALTGKRPEQWQGRFMSSVARLVFTDACLSSLPLYTMGLFGRFFSEGTGDKRKYHWVNWPEVCQRKDQGGLGMNTKLMNIALMVKWIWRLYTQNLWTVFGLELLEQSIKVH
jgi:hypothetical protein